MHGTIATLSVQTRLAKTTAVTWSHKAEIVKFSTLKVIG